MRHSRQLQEETGAILILVALLMVALLGIAALVIDLGGLYGHDRELQTAADAAALAGATELIVSQGSQMQAGVEADSYISKNVAESRVDDGNVTREIAVDATSVTVDLKETGVPFFFATVLGRDSGTVRAHAKAEVKYLTGVDNAFPVAFMYANPDHWRFVFKEQGTDNKVAQFDLYDSQSDNSEEGYGVFDQVENSDFSGWSPGSGVYDVYLYAMDIDNNDAIELDGPIGLFYVPAADSRLQRVGMERTTSGGVIVYAHVNNDAPAVEAKFGNGGQYEAMTPTGEGTDGKFRVTLYPSPNTGNDGWGTSDLSIRVQRPAGGGGPNWDVYSPVGRYVDFAPDVPILDVMMSPIWNGYSTPANEPTQPKAMVTVRVLEFEQSYVLKLSAQGGGNYLAGNWRWADIWADYSLKKELEGLANEESFEGLLTTEKKDSDEMDKGMYIDGPLWPETGNKQGALKKEVFDKLEDQVVAVPIVNFAPNLSGESDPYTISGFAGFKIESYEHKGSDKGELRGRFIEWMDHGPWEDDPTGSVYLETAVLTE